MTKGQRVRTPMTAAGWMPRAYRNRNRGGKGSESGGANSRNTKRSRLGNPQQRAQYKHAKGYKWKGYARLCYIADGLNGMRGKRSYAE